MPPGSSLTSQVENRRNEQVRSDDEDDGSHHSTSRGATDLVGTAFGIEALLARDDTDDDPEDHGLEHAAPDILLNQRGDAIREIAMSTEAENEDREQFSVTRLLDSLGGVVADPAAEVVAAVIAAVRAHAGDTPPSDDLTALDHESDEYRCCAPRPPSAPPLSRPIQNP